jgi:hypothetical protein
MSTALRYRANALLHISNRPRAGQLRNWGSILSSVKNFPFSTSSRPVFGPTQPPIQWVTGALSPGVKRPGSETDHSPPN